jgi:methylenetetrahydrofolate reductase (NADPH)
MDTYFLVNVVHNDFKDIEATFRPFFRVGEIVAAESHKQLKGIVNGNGHAVGNGATVSSAVNGVSNGIGKMSLAEYGLKPHHSNHNDF